MMKRIWLDPVKEQKFLSLTPRNEEDAADVWYWIGYLQSALKMAEAEDE